MSNPHSINPKFYASDGLPIFLGDPHSKPNPIFPEFPWYIILAVSGAIADKTGKTVSPLSDEGFCKLFKIVSELPIEDTEGVLMGFLESMPRWGDDEEKLWKTFFHRIQNPEKYKNINGQAPSPFLSPSGAKEFDRLSQKHQDEFNRLDNLKKERRGGAACRKYYERIFKMSAHEFISNELRDPLAANIHTFMIKHADPHSQNLDPAYYDSSHAKIGRAVKRSIRTIRRKISKLKRKHWICLIAPSRLDPPRCAKYQLARTPEEMKHFELFMVDYKKKKHQVNP